MGGRVMKIKLNMIEEIMRFINGCCSKFTGKIFAEQSNQKINAKSVLGLYSLDLSKPILVRIDTDDKNEENKFYEFVSKWKVEE